MRDKGRKIFLEEDEILVTEIENAQIVEEDWQKGQFILEDIMYLDTSAASGNGTNASIFAIYDFDTTNQIFDDLQKEDKETIRSVIDTNQTA